MEDRGKRDEVVREYEAQGYEVLATVHSQVQAQRILIELASAGGYQVIGYHENSMVCRREVDGKLEELSILKRSRVQYYIVKREKQKEGAVS